MSEERTLVEAVEYLGRQVKELGKGDQYGPGAIEFLAITTKEGLRDVASSIDEHAQAVRELAAAVRSLRPG